MAVAVGASPGPVEAATVGDAATSGPLVDAAWGATAGPVGCAGLAHETATTSDIAIVAQRFEIISWVISRFNETV